MHPQTFKQHNVLSSLPGFILLGVLKMKWQLWNSVKIVSTDHIFLRRFFTTFHLAIWFT